VARGAEQDPWETFQEEVQPSLEEVIRFLSFSF
jgi:hypothetical protein